LFLTIAEAQVPIIVVSVVLAVVVVALLLFSYRLAHSTSVYNALFLHSIAIL